MTSKVAKNNKTNYLHFTNLNVSRPMRLVALLLFLISCICFSLFVILSTWWLPKINHVCFWTLSLQIVLFFFRINKTDNYGFKMIHNAIIDPVIIQVHVELLSNSPRNVVWMYCIQYWIADEPKYTKLKYEYQWNVRSYSWSRKLANWNDINIAIKKL